MGRTQPRSAPEPEFLTIKDLAEMLGLPLSGIYRWRRLGVTPPAIKVGKHVWFRRADVEAWLQDHEERPAS